MKAEQEKVCHVPVVTIADVLGTFSPDTDVCIFLRTQKLKEEQDKKAAEEARIKAEQEKVRFVTLWNRFRMKHCHVNRITPISAAEAKGRPREEGCRGGQSKGGKGEGKLRHVSFYKPFEMACLHSSYHRRSSRKR